MRGKKQKNKSSTSFVLNTCRALLFFETQIAINQKFNPGFTSL
jgi:hypothetical protein